MQIFPKAPSVKFYEVHFSKYVQGMGGSDPLDFGQGGRGVSQRGRTRGEIVKYYYNLIMYRMHVRKW